MFIVTLFQNALDEEEFNYSYCFTWEFISVKSFKTEKPKILRHRNFFGIHNFMECFLLNSLNYIPQILVPNYTEIMSINK